MKHRSQPPSSRSPRSSPGTGPKSSSWSLVDEPLSEPFRLEPAPGLILGNKIRLERLIRTGGMSSVWEATHLDLERPVAVKIVNTTGNNASEARARVEREAKVAARVRSPNVVEIIDHGIDRGLPYLVMELLSGEDLGARLRRVKRISIADTSRILDHAAIGLERAHESGLIHRDLKPDNIFLTKIGDDEGVKILDFGMAKAIREDDELAGGAEGSIMGTPFAMSPEQAQRRPSLDHRSDLWSLGVVAFRALTGVRPFRSKSIGELLTQILSDPIPAPSSINPALPAEIDAFFTRALAREPEGRFPSARAMAQAFAEAAAKIREAGGDVSAASLGPASTMPLSAIDASSEFYKAPIVVKETLAAPKPQGGDKRVDIRVDKKDDKRDDKRDDNKSVQGLAASGQGATAIEPAPAKIEPAPAKIELAPAKEEPPRRASFTIAVVIAIVALLAAGAAALLLTSGQ